MCAISELEYPLVPDDSPLELVPGATVQIIGSRQGLCASCEHQPLQSLCDTPVLLCNNAAVRQT